MSLLLKHYRTVTGKMGPSCPKFTQRCHPFPTCLVSTYCKPVGPDRLHFVGLFPERLIFQDQKVNTVWAFNLQKLSSYQSGFFDTMTCICMYRYESLNVECLDSIRRYSSDIPAFQRNHPRSFVKQCLKRMPPAASSTDHSMTADNGDGVFRVRSVDSSNVCMLYKPARLTLRHRLVPVQTGTKTICPVSTCWLYSVYIQHMDGIPCHLLIGRVHSFS